MVLESGQIKDILEVCVLKCITHTFSTLPSLIIGVKGGCGRQGSAGVVLLLLANEGKEEKRRGRERKTEKKERTVGMKREEKK